MTLRNLVGFVGGEHVDPDVLGDGGTQDFISGESVILCAGPSSLASGDLEGGVFENVYPIGVVQQVGITQSKQLQQLFEIGSAESYFIPGKTFANVQLSRVLVQGASLLKAIYSGTFKDWDADLERNLPGDPYDHRDYSTSADMYINLGSEFFNKPLGLMLMMRDVERDNYAVVYLENCFIQGHQMSMGAQQTLIMENVQIRVAKVVPIDVGPAPAE